MGDCFSAFTLILQCLSIYDSDDQRFCTFQDELLLQTYNTISIFTPLPMTQLNFIKFLNCFYFPNLVLTLRATILIFLSNFHKTQNLNIQRTVCPSARLRKPDLVLTPRDARNTVVSASDATTYESVKRWANIFAPKLPHHRSLRKFFPQQ